MRSRIVITGEGIVSAIGNDKAATLTSLREGKSGIGRMRYLQSRHHELPVGEVSLSDTEIKALLGIAPSEEISRNSLLGMLAVGQALKEAGIERNQESGMIPRILLITGTTVGGMDITERHFDDMLTTGKANPCLLKHGCGSSTDDIAAHFGLFSAHTTISTACSSAANALILGAELLKADEADIVVAGGMEALTRFHLNGFHSLMILDQEPCRPFDAQRAGLNLGEGAAFVVMEREADAQERGAAVHAWLSGYGNACDAFHQTASSENGEGAFLAMREALEMARLTPGDIDYINAHGTGTPNNDLSETAALRRVFAEQMPPVSSTKGFTGHTTSASGSIEAVICMLAMRHRFLPSNLRWAHQMPGGITPTLGGQGRALRHVLCNAFGFGGNDTALILSAQPADEGLPSSSSEVRQPVIAAKVEITSEEELAEIRRYVKPLEARRLGRIMKSALLSSLKAMEQAGVSCPDAIITATSLGCLEYSELLLMQLREEGEVMLKPTWFMQSTHNTIGSAVAIHTGCHGYNVTYTQGAQSLEWALWDARRLIRSGRARSVLVGMHDETTPRFRSMMEQLGARDLCPIHSIAMILTCGE